jgi:two-component system phosphate regulon sensor histidine kinase PhoR
VLINLIENAINYGREGGTVTVTASSDERETVLSVSDNGPGIPVEARERVFERFYRLDKARSRERGGTGLGLSIVKHIALAHGGRVWVTEAPGGGACFCVAIPQANETRDGER